MLVQYAIGALAIMVLGAVWALVLFLARRQQPEAHIGEKSRGCLGCLNNGQCALECEDLDEETRKSIPCARRDERKNGEAVEIERGHAHTTQ